MFSSRLEAFSDGVIAIIITIMVLELKPPHEARLAALRPILPVFLSYVLSFLYLAIYWNNHHHLLRATKRVTGSIMWANLHLLFWLSLVPFVTGWAGAHFGTAGPMACYGGVLLMSGLAYLILQGAIVRAHGKDSRLAAALGSDWKGKLSLAAYTVAIPLAFLDARVSETLYVLVALMWVVPDRRIERAADAEK